MAGEYDETGSTTGFASPAGDSLEGPIDLSAMLDLRRPHRYPVRVLGEALRERGILPGDVLIADAAAPPMRGKVCVAFVHGDVLLATLAFRGGQWWLRPSSAEREQIAVEGEAAEVWAIVCGLVRTDV
jgi:DNA polymerase V